MSHASAVLISHMNKIVAHTRRGREEHDRGTKEERLSAIEGRKKRRTRERKKGAALADDWTASDSAVAQSWS